MTKIDVTEFCAEFGYNYQELAQPGRADLGVLCMCTPKNSPRCAAPTVAYPSDGPGELALMEARLRAVMRVAREGR